MVISFLTQRTAVPQGMREGVVGQLEFELIVKVEKDSSLRSE